MKDDFEYIELGRPKISKVIDTLNMLKEKYGDVECKCNYDGRKCDVEITYYQGKVFLFNS